MMNLPDWAHEGADVVVVAAASAGDIFCSTQVAEVKKRYITTLDGTKWSLVLRPTSEGALRRVGNGR